MLLATTEGEQNSMKKTTKRILTMLLAIVLIVGQLPATAMAEEQEAPQIEENTDAVPENGAAEEAAADNP